MDRTAGTILPIHDLSLTISPAMVTWPGDPKVRIEACSRIADGQAANVSQLSLGLHTGTHVDPPHHFDDRGMTVDQLPLDVLIGRAWVCDVAAERDVEVFHLLGSVPQDATRLLLKTRNSLLWHNEVREFTPDFVALSEDAARWIVQRGIQLLGVDYLSLERPGSAAHSVHHTLLEAGVVVAEGLDLSSLASGWYNLCCLPLKVAHGDGAPARAVAIGPLN
jgi:arylformamidase